LNAADLHRESLVVDAHHDLLMLVAMAHARGNTDTFRDRWIPELRAGGVDVQVLPVFVAEETPESQLRRALEMIDALQVEVSKNPNEVLLCRTKGDLEEARSHDLIALILALEGGEPLGPNLSVLRLMHQLGLRMMSFTWNHRTLLADGSDEQETGARLTRLGVAMLGEMERLGVILDVSHLSDAGFWHVAEIATKPFIASHSNCRAVFDHQRALTDDQLRAIAERGGVVGMNVHPMLVMGDGATVDDCLDHLEHALEVAGEDHVGLGPDFCAELDELGAILEPPVASGIDGLERSADLPSFTAAMLGRGLSEKVVQKVIGTNFARVLAEGLPD
jgi:membrane dipeptidase